jgi:hypothetical protein
VRSLELKLERLLTTGTFNLVVKDPIATALGGRFGRNNGHRHNAATVCPRNLSNIPRDFPSCQSSVLILVESDTATTEAATTLDFSGAHIVCRSR